MRRLIVLSVISMVLLIFSSCDLFFFTDTGEGIFGKIKAEQTEEPIQGVTVIAYDQSGRVVASYISNSDGSYFLRVQSSDFNYRVVFSKQGYQTETRYIKVSKGENIRYDITLKKVN